MKIERPYCKSELIQGFFHSGKYGFMWHDEDEKWWQKLSIFGGETLKEYGRVKCHRCKSCNRIIIDLEDM
ncbi:PF20097 family protein [Tepidibacter aestuarii]|uniref:PF20097 family protein n=1 Tax=Tepidibacter aestuarii TaxID=2925782 RepID=UPI0020BE3C39|nr:PF20097 family protein [Tepidibacter aestuarii]CAH2214882.1 conserved protein of unknown function [Tepidibacter aestuarii]